MWHKEYIHLLKCVHVLLIILFSCQSLWSREDGHPPHFKDGPWSSRGVVTILFSSPSQWMSWNTSAGIAECPALLASTSSFWTCSRYRIYCRAIMQSKSDFPQRSDPHLSLCSTAILCLLWESIRASLTMLSQALQIFFWRKCIHSVCTSSSRSVRYWGWGKEQKWVK